MRASLTWTDAAKSLLILALATGLSFILKFFAIGDQNIIMMYMLAVLVISRITNGLVYGVAASVISVLVFNFFFTHPVFSFSATAPGYPVTFVIMLLAALIISTLTVRVKTQVKLAAKREQRTKTLYEISCKLLVTRGTRQIADLINSYIVQIFSRSVVFYTDPDSPEPPAALAKGPEDTALLYSEDERSVATWSFVNQKPAGAGTDTHAGAGLYYLPVVSEGRSLGVIGVSCARGVPGVNSKFFLQLIVAQAAMALERQGLSDAQSQATVLSEKEKLRNNLLRAISHDLRTPLTVIHGASSTIIENADALSEGEKRELLNNIKDDSGWLIRMVENLLFVTRLIDSGTGLVKATEAVEEIISETIGRIAKRFPEARVAVSMPDEVLLLPMDGTLIEQVLLNLLENAIKHNVKNQEITIRVEKDGRKVWFRVEDLGSGILEGDLPQLFNGFADPKPSPDSARGFGVGLSICKSIIDAHDGQIMAENNKGGGATFSFWLPQEGDMSGE
ncbi:MAG: DUF4118 domain-containing protein [Coriobacteriia bacterium]|nr:DUF4118 domain-containing protein [Coriobacteriia bacterium]